ncbi:hypothetical protein G7046_g4444 [Stylonectria norvegica]|nr:hypothetical protein G7046_g4444 [Stylonectria norvegica]
MIRNMEQPHDPKVDYNITQLPPLDLSMVNPRTPREWTTTAIMRLADQATLDLEGYNAHVQKTKEVYEAALKKELEREAA